MSRLMDAVFWFAMFGAIFADPTGEPRYALYGYVVLMILCAMGWSVSKTPPALGSSRSRTFRKGIAAGILLLVAIKTTLISLYVPVACLMLIGWINLDEFLNAWSKYQAKEG